MSLSKADKIRAEIDAMRTVACEVSKKISELLEALKVAEAPTPPPGSWLTVEVKFHTSPHWYRYLILHVPGKGYYTTASMDENKYFATWGGMLAYFNKDDIEMRSAFHTLTPNTPSYGGSIESGSR